MNKNGIWGKHYLTGSKLKLNHRNKIYSVLLFSFNCFMGTNLDKLVIGNYYLSKDNQNKNSKIDYKSQFEKD